MLAFVRRAKDPSDFLIVACNFTPVVRTEHVVGVPRGGWYREVFNSDSKFYGGSNLGNFPRRHGDRARLAHAAGEADD